MNPGYRTQPWLRSATFDLAWLVGPGWVATLLALTIAATGSSTLALSPLLWLILVVGIDVSHVYSTLFRTYLDPQQRHFYQKPLLYIPILSWLGGVLAYSIDASLFWSILAYLAVFHFIRQQYGFMMLYGRNEGDLPQWARQVDRLAIYLATIYPMVHWHSLLPRNFEWLITGDFIVGLPRWVAILVGWSYVGTLLVYCGKELLLLFKYRCLNIPRNLLFGGTALAWYVGIVALNADLPFTLTNVVAHGIPYIALVWLYGNRRSISSTSPLTHSPPIWFRPYLLPCWILALITLAWLEEGLWDALIWRDHPTLFPLLSSLPSLRSDDILTFVVPLLAVPQATHYILDGFIWRIRTPDSGTKLLMYGLHPTHPNLSNEDLSVDFTVGQSGLSEGGGLL